MKHQYKIAIRWNHTSNTFFAYTPELSGCNADGASFTEAIDNVKMLIEEWMLIESNPTILSMNLSNQLLRA